MCVYEKNSFCSSLAPETRQALCGHCFFRQYRKGQTLTYQYWVNTTALLVEGLTLNLQLEGNQWMPCGLASPGDLISAHIEDSDCSMAGEGDILCLQKCTVAFFDRDFVRELFETDLSFVKAFYKSEMRFCAREVLRFMHETGQKDAYASVRYVVAYCREHRLAVPTHEQISMICNRSRSTVTEMMHKLIASEPELFAPVGASPEEAETEAP